MPARCSHFEARVRPQSPAKRFLTFYILFALAASFLPAKCFAQARNPQPAASRNADALQELKLRYDALTSATASGNPQAVAQASQKVSALALREMAGLRMMVGAYPQAAELLRQTLALEDVAEIHSQLAIALLNSSKPKDAAAEMQQIVTLHPGDAQAWFLKGKAETAAEDYPRAVDSLERSLKLDRNVNTEYGLAYAWLKFGQKDKAQKIFAAIISEYGDRAIWHVVFAGAYRESGNPQDAIREFRQAIAMDPKVGHSQFFLGLTLLEQNHWAQTDDSMAAFRAAVEQDPSDYFGNFYLGVGEAELKLFADSNRHLKVAAEAQPNTPEIYLYLGLNAYQQSDYPAAKTYLLKAVELTGEDRARNNYQIRRAYIALGRIEFIAGRKEEADKYVALAKEMQNRSLENSAASISYTVMSSGMQHAPEVLPYIKVPTQAIPQEPAQVDPTAPIDASALAQAPLTEQQQQETKRYEAQLRQVLSSSFNDWGTSEARQGQFQSALDHFHEAERWDNSTPGLMRNAGIAALKVGDIQEAIRALQTAVQVDPKDSSARSRLAITLFRTDQYEQATAQFEALGDEVFRNPDLAYAYSYTLVRLNQSKKATEALAHAAQLTPTPAMLVSIGDLYSVLEAYEPAVAAYRKALEQDSSLPKVRYKLGAALLRLDRPQEALPVLEEEAKSSPDDADVQYNLAYALLQTSQKDRALAMLQSLTAKHPEHPQAQYEFGKTLLEDGKVAEAVQHLEVAAKLDPDSDYIHYQLQVAYRRNGQKAEADREVEIYREMKAKKREKAVAAMPKAAQ